MGFRHAKKNFDETCGPKTFQRKVQIGKKTAIETNYALKLVFIGVFLRTRFFFQCEPVAPRYFYIFVPMVVGTIHILPQALELLVCKCPCSKYPSLNFKLRLKFPFFPNIPHFLQQPHYWCLTGTTLALVHRALPQLAVWDFWPGFARARAEFSLGVRVSSTGTHICISD
jgi:hypothetical protein